MQPNMIAPPPWALTGEGMVLIYSFPGKFNQKYGFMADYQRQGYKGWIGAVIMADYKNSNVGPYQELIFMPGLFNLRGKITFSISKIYVSTYDSLWNGIENWGIPKEPAHFKITHNSDGARAYEVSREGKLFFGAHVKPYGPRIPVSTKFFPWIRLTQQLRGQWLMTRPAVSGKAQLSSLKNILSDPDFFPPLNRVRPLAVFSIRDLFMTFPKPYQ